MCFILRPIRINGADENGSTAGVALALKFSVPLAVASEIEGVDFDQKYSDLHLGICTEVVEVTNVQCRAIIGDTRYSLPKARLHWLSPVAHDFISHQCHARRGGLPAQTEERRFAWEDPLEVRL